MMKRTVSALLSICLVAGLAATYARAQMKTQATTQTLRTVVTQTAAAAALTSDVRVEYARKLCSDTWVELCADPTYATSIQFPRDGSMQIEIKYDSDGECESYSYAVGAANRSDAEDAVQFADGLDAQILVNDLDSDDFIHYDAEGIISDHRLMIRQSRWNGKTDCAQRLRGSSWKSNWFSVRGIDTVRIEDFDVYPVNETTAYLEYRAQVGNDRVRAAAVQTPDANTLNVYLITTYTEEGFCPETALFAEQWTAVS